MKRMLALLSAVGLFACAHPTPLKKNPAPGKPTTRLALSVHSADGGDSNEHVMLPPLLIHLDIYQFEVPLGAISENDKFWWNVDSRSIGEGGITRDILFKNGLRAGIAPKAAWSFFRNVFQQLPNRTRKTEVTKDRVMAMQLDLDKPAADEDLFYFDPSNHLQGRSYQGSTNSMMLSFEPSQRDPEKIRMVMCPVVTTQRHRLKFTALNQEYESPFEDVSRLYDLNLKVDVPIDDFLIVAPSPDARNQTTVGGLFLVNKTGAEPLEQVVVIVPTFLRLDGKPFVLSDTSVRH